MPVTKRIPESKRRSRKGCLVCRKRRRKCDEQRPQCHNCSSRGVACEYGEWTFVSRVQPLSSSSDRPSEDTSDKSELTIVPAEDLSFLAQPDSPIVPTGPPERPVGLTPVQHDPVHHGSPWVSLSSPHTTGSTYEVITPSKWNDPNFPQQGSSSKQAAMLRFRYQLIPWMDSNNCKSAFGPNIMNLAHDKGVITDCILYYANFRERRACTPGDSGDICQDILNRLILEDTFTADVGRTILAASDLFNTPPSRWATLPSYYVEGSAQSQSFEDTAEPLKTLLRLQLKINLAASIVTNKPPSTMLPLPLHNPFVNHAASAAEIYDACLCILAKTLQLVHHELIPLLSGFHGAQTQAVDFYTSKWAQWSSLWTSCTTWFQGRPRGMGPVLEGPDVSVSRDVPFPADVYTSAIALQANLIMHISSVFLLAHKPRLAKLPRLPGRLNSRSWHAQKVARITVWNSFDEQWDPIVVSALLFIAREMTHTSQQDLLLSCFHKIANITQIPLEDDIATLRTYWRLSFHGSPPDAS